MPLIQKTSQPSIVLGTLQLRETDLLLTLLGKETGKITAIAKNAKNSKKRFLGGVDLFDCGVFELSPGPKRTSWYAVDSIERRHSWQNGFKKPIAFTLATCLLELTNFLNAEGDQESGQLFNPFFHSLKKIDESSSELEQLSTAVFFIALMLSKLGFDTRESLKDPQINYWLDLMIQTNAPIIPQDSSLIKKGLIFYLNQAEKIAERTINSKIEVLRILQKLELP
jgi:DNA repair protein RecO